MSRAGIWRRSICNGEDALGIYLPELDVFSHKMQQSPVGRKSSSLDLCTSILLIKTKYTRKPVHYNYFPWYQLCADVLRTASKFTQLEGLYCYFKTVVPFCEWLNVCQQLKKLRFLQYKEFNKVSVETQRYVYRLRFDHFETTRCLLFATVTQLPGSGICVVIRSLPNLTCLPAY